MTASRLSGAGIQPARLHCFGAHRGGRRIGYQMCCAEDELVDLRARDALPVESATLVDEDRVADGLLWASTMPWIWPLVDVPAPQTQQLQKAAAAGPPARKTMRSAPLPA